MNRYPGDFGKFARSVQRQLARAQQSGGKYPSGQPPRGAFGALGGLFLLIGGGFLANEALFNVDGGHRAIVYSRINGVQPRIYPEGTHFIIPWVENPVVYDVRAKPRNVSSLTGTKDLQMVNITCRVLSSSVSYTHLDVYKRQYI